MARQPVAASSASRRSAKDRALDLLAYRSRSREEIRRRLSRAGFEEDEIGTALDDLERVGLVDDERFARELATYQVGGKGAGRRLALGALRQAGVDTETAERAVAEAAGDDEQDRAEELARSRARRLSGLEERVAFQRLVGFLMRRGYEGEVARTAARRALVGETTDPDG
ncbi:MAG TPA: regulatory protein RecX [Actinomycetota bacterium]|nr:regulatory protein RecX [Actinomycetota bacterium]